ncbi:MAG: guanosine polyphosphate pyrophosphohydrolase [Saccharofermentans sp.]|nr:guanosine polyphosphate pyrophosphohydrolase [Saccharofermentans sp.]
MITLNDYLYSGDTVLKILKLYTDALQKNANETSNEIDKVHCNFLLQYMELLEHNDFLSSQSQRIREFYKYMAKEYPFLSFTFKGRIKSLIRAEEKFNGTVVKFISEYYKKHGELPPMTDLENKLNSFRDLIAYRIVISLPQCHVLPGETTEDKERREIDYIYEIAGKLPSFLEERGFTPVLRTSTGPESNVCDKIPEDARKYYKDYIHNVKSYGYRSLHIAFFDQISESFIEVQMRTKDMDDNAEIGLANHLGYEERQERERNKRNLVPQGLCKYFDEAYERGILLQQIDLSKVDVNMFGAINNSLVNDGCGLYRGRLILPFEHLSRFQNDLID